MPPKPAAGERLLKLWRRLDGIPGGRWLFARIFARMVPYSASVAPRFEAIEPGYARVSIRQRRRLEQHLGSIHAIALANLAELVSGLAMNAALPAGRRGIVTAFRMEYFKKARGLVTAESRIALADIEPDGEREFGAEIRDEAGDVVARGTATWKLQSPDRRRETGVESSVESGESPVGGSGT